MSVIYGIFHPSGLAVDAAEAEKLRRGLDRVRFDREGVRQEGNVLLGVLLRQLVRNDAETAPLCDGELTLCADARLDNRAELAEKLGIPDDAMPAMPDSRLILEAYRRWGADSPKQLLGDFAFAIYDKTAQRLFCARDHIGIRPFFYYWIDGSIAFCTLRPPLMASCPVTPTPNDSFIVAAFIRCHTELAQTVANEILRLPPAHSLTLDASGLHLQRYWQPESLPELKLADENEYARALREVFSQAVACRTVTDRRVGSHLSSGVDSGAVTVLAARELRKQGKSPLPFAWTHAPESSPVKPGDERALIQDICRQENLECRYSDLTAEEALRLYHEAIPVWGDSQFLPELKHLANYAHEDCRIVLSGWGGDELTSFNGNRVYLADLLRRKGWLSLLKTTLQMRIKRLGGLRSMAKEVFYPFIPEPLYARYFKLPVLRISESLIHPALVSIVHTESRKRHRWHQRDVKAFQRRYLIEGFLLYRTEAWAELGEMHGVNYLYPVFDKRVVEFVLSLPTDQLCRHGWRRYIFRNAMDGVLPPSVRWNRTKAEFALGEHMAQFLSQLNSHITSEMQNVARLPAFRRYFDEIAVNNKLSSSSFIWLYRVYTHVKFLENSFPPDQIQGEKK